MDREEIFTTVAEAAVERARRRGAQQAEAYISSSRELSVEVRNGGVETLKQAGERGLGLRVLLHNRMGFSYTTDLTPAGIEEVVERALANCRMAAEDPYLQLPGPSGVYPRLDLYDPQIVGVPVKEKIRLAQLMEESARQYDPRVKVIESSCYHDAEALVTVANSSGISLSYRGAYCGLYIALAAVEGEESQTGFALDYSTRYSALKPGELGELAAQRAVRMLGASPVATCRVPVVMEPYVAAGFLGLIAPAVSAEAVQKKRSLFADRLGSKVASELVTVVDDGTLEGGIASAPFDGEGVPTGRTVLIRRGELAGYLHNTYTAVKDGARSTGNGVRSSFKTTPEVGTTNFFIEAGSKTPEEIVGEIDYGLYVVEVLGMHTANPISGDFSVGVAGLLIENGELTRPVRGMAIGGNIIELLESVDAVGSDLKFFGGRGAPTLRVGALTVGGQ